ncbi:MAG: hypothetical protein P8J32_06550 [bacterium]|nr:hypothetical protein [bacterium]
MIPYPVSHNVTGGVFSPTDIASLVLWYDANEVTDTGSNGTADILLNQATAPAAPTDASASGGAVSAIDTDAYAAGEDAIIFDASNSEYYAAASYSELQFDTDEPWTVSWWERSANSDHYILDTTSTGRGVQPGIGIYWASGRLFMEIKDGVGGEYSYRSGVIQDFEAFHQYTITYDGSKSTTGFQMYEDGTLIAGIGLNNVTFGTTTHNVGALHVGRKKDGTGYGDHAQGHLMMFNTVLTSQNISDLASYY